MDQLCTYVSCQQTSRVLCYCCNRKLCLDHLSNHDTLTYFQSNSLSNQITILYEQVKGLDIDKLIDNDYQILNKWKDNSVKAINRFFEKKYDELERYYNQRIHKRQKEIDYFRHKLDEVNHKQDNINEDNLKELQSMILNSKQELDKIEQRTVTVKTRSLSIDNNLITIGDMQTEGFDLTALAPPYKVFHFSENSGMGLASNEEYLLIDQCPDISLYDKDLNIVQQAAWKHGIIRDICWSSGISCFIVITETSQAFLINGRNLSINPIEPMNNHLWMSCTCSNSLLYLSSLANGIIEFSLLPSYHCTRRWDPPISCEKNQLIKDIHCNDEKLALIIALFSNNLLHLILRSLITFDPLFLIRLDVKYLSYQQPIRCCSFQTNEWLVVDTNTTQIFHITKDGQVKATLKYDERPCNVTMFGSNTLVIRTENSLNFHQVLY